MTEGSDRRHLVNERKKFIEVVRKHLSSAFLRSAYPPSALSSPAQGGFVLVSFVPVNDIPTRIVELAVNPHTGSFFRFEVDHK